MLYNENFAKVTAIDVIKFKIKWVARVVWFCINKPLNILLEWT